MRPRSKSFVSRSDLQSCLNQYIEVYNNRLTKKFSTCKITQAEECHLKGGIKLNFDLVRSVPVFNTVILDGNHQEEFLTFSSFQQKVRASRWDTYAAATKKFFLARLVVPLLLQDTVADLMGYFVAKFNIVQEAAQELQLFERELSVTQQDIFYRKISPEEHPLELFMLWKINGERKSFVLTDHDPNERKYSKCSMLELDKRLANLDTEEAEVIQSIKDNYSKARALIHELIPE